VSIWTLGDAIYNYLLIISDLFNDVFSDFLDSLVALTLGLIILSLFGAKAVISEFLHLDTTVSCFGPSLFENVVSIILEFFQTTSWNTGASFI